MFDATPLTLDEITDQCHALTHAVIELDDPVAKEVLTFVLAERLELLAITLQNPEGPETDSGVVGTGERQRPEFGERQHVAT
ncbi:hypothetical protein CS369_06785 [Candidatus Symbiopectobacterium sp. 'North America']|uniref:hypothetical protein n=1 Tax=Candidatus Symbiopectobacterium sp. 'North America' TaxID=2794574 RepID=UPI0018C9CC6B|nr:hypothetical protein [Candidatus Symbiopectobacterium sp. 'North America']MBG6244565.1 hypothetical protein [Candidatus Symbiopectobacterium sp. 'North America']